MGGRDNSETCEFCGLERGGLNDVDCDCMPSVPSGWKKAVPEHHIQLHEALGLHAGDLMDFEWHELLRMVREDREKIARVNAAMEDRPWHRGA